MLAIPTWRLFFFKFWPPRCIRHLRIRRGKRFELCSVSCRSFCSRPTAPSVFVSRATSTEHCMEHADRWFFVYVKSDWMHCVYPPIGWLRVRSVVRLPGWCRRKSWCRAAGWCPARRAAASRSGCGWRGGSRRHQRCRGCTRPAERSAPAQVLQQQASDVFHLVRIAVARYTNDKSPLKIVCCSNLPKKLETLILISVTLQDFHHNTFLEWERNWQKMTIFNPVKQMIPEQIDKIHVP